MANRQRRRLCTAPYRTLVYKICVIIKYLNFHHMHFVVCVPPTFRIKRQLLNCINIYQSARSFGVDR
jgi:hypothetical protein